MENLSKNKTFYYFNEISKIPRESGNESFIKNYLVSFAKSKNLPFYEDNFNNVIIYKKTCDCEEIILQAHIDMVCVKTPKSNIDFSKDGINIVRKGAFLTARNTSLGADDGIGVAIILDILDSDLPCNIEAVFTTNEETTMKGAYNIDTKKLKSKKLICLDGFKENTIITSSASFTDYLINFNTEKLFVDNTPTLKTFSLSVFGLEGGHSGFDINKNRGSSHKLLTQLLEKIEDVYLIKFSGGRNFNVIPSKSDCVFSTNKNEKELKNIIKYFFKTNKKIYKNLRIKCSRQINQTLTMLNGKKLLDFILKFQQGVLATDEENNVVASQNISEVDSEKGLIKIGIRCSNNSEKVIIQNLNDICKEFDFCPQVLDTQPGFATKPNSNLLNDLKQSCLTNPKELKMHIAVESGIFQNRIKDLDVVIVSPTIENAHSTNEKLDISSVINTSIWLKNFFNKH